MIRILNVLGESKKKRKQESILNKWDDKYGYWYYIID
jgi:hypothetical protein